MGDGSQREGLADDDQGTVTDGAGRDDEGERLEMDNEGLEDEMDQSAGEQTLGTVTGMKEVFGRCMWVLQLDAGSSVEA